MPMGSRAVVKFNPKAPVSYRVGQSGFMNDSRNVYTNQNVLDTRHGISRFNSTAFGTVPVSLSFFKDNSDNNYLLAKDATVLYKANASGAHTSLKAGLLAGNKHRAVSFNNRHIMAIGSDGLFSYDGTTFTQLGQAAGSAATAAKDEGNGTLTNSVYEVGYTYYSSTLGFESNVSAASSQVTTDGGNDAIAVSGLPSTAANGFIDTIRLYLKDVTNATDYLLFSELSLGTTTDSIDTNPTSTTIPPTTNAPPGSGGAKYVAVFGSRLVYSGNSSFPSDIYFSNIFLPDAFDDTATDRTINIDGEGPVTGIAVGLYNNDSLSPYLVAFKRNSYTIYSEIGGTTQQVPSFNGVGCVSHDTIQVINGDIFFMSTQGWHSISNGRLRTTKNTKFIDGGQINDIFTRSGYVYEINQANSGSFFSVYYPTLKQYLTFISEGSNNSITKCHNFEFETGGFRPYDFQVSFKDAVLGEASSKEVVYLSGEGGYIYQHSTSETVGTDIDKDNTSISIDAFALFYWQDDGDLDSSSSFGPFMIKALAQANPITVKYFLDYSLQSPTDLSYAFADPETGFILDVSKLDEGILGDGRTLGIGRGNIFKTGQSLLIGLYKSAVGESMGVIEMQLDMKKNGNPN